MPKLQEGHHAGPVAGDEQVSIRIEKDSPYRERQRYLDDMLQQARKALEDLEEAIFPILSPGSSPKPDAESPTFEGEPSSLVAELEVRGDEVQRIYHGLCSLRARVQI